MKIRAICSTASLVTATTLLAGCVADETVSPAEEYIFGLSAEEVLATKRLTTKAITDAEWLEINRGPFSCGQHTIGLCEVIPPARASEVVELGYRLAIAGADDEAIARAQDAAIDEARAANPDYEGRLRSVQHFTAGSTVLRLRVEAWAVATTFGGQLKAKGECKVQNKIAGSWWAINPDCISGNIEATWTPSTTTFTSDTNGCYGGTTLTFGPSQRAATSLTTTVWCYGREGAWEASGATIEAQSI
jgi:hypothetical protein